MSTRCLGFLNLVAVCGLFLGPLVNAQNPNPGYPTQTGLPDYGSFLHSEIDTVDLATGGVKIHIPLVSRKSRGFDYTYSYRYESRFWQVYGQSFDYIDPNTGVSQPGESFTWTAGGFQIVPEPIGVGSSLSSSVGGNISYNEQMYQCTQYPSNQQSAAFIRIRSNWQFIAGDGTVYNFPIRSVDLIQTSANTCIDDFAYTPPLLTGLSDNGQLKIDISNYSSSGIAKVWFKNGSQFKMTTPAAATQITDTNGNQCCAVQNGWVTDSLGRPLRSTHNTPDATAIDYYDSNGQLRTIQVRQTSIQLAPSFPTASPLPNCPIIQWPGSASVLQSIQLPNGLSYTFSYDDPSNPGHTNPFGEITKITLPTGGYIKYKWITIAQRDAGPNGLTCGFNLDARVLSERRVSADGLTEAIWQYSYSGGTAGPPAGVTTVTDPQGNVQVHTFNGPYSSETLAEYRQGASTVLKTVKQDWGWDTGPTTASQSYTASDPTGSFALNGVRNPRIIRTTITLADTNQVKKSEADYFLDCHYYSAFGQNFIDCPDNANQVREFDYGAGAPGPLVRYTNLTYRHQENSMYFNAHFWNRVSDKQVFDAVGNLKARTQFSYDTTSIADTSSLNVPYHDYAAYPYTNTVRGNQTVISRWRSTDGAWLATTNYFNDVGNLVQTTDPGLHTTSFSYADNFTDGINRNSQAYVTQITYPVTNGVNHIERKQYFWNSGAVAASCGQNFPAASACNNTYPPPQPDYAKYAYDLLDRPLTVDRGDGGRTTFAFNEAVLPVSVSATTTIDQAQSLTNSAIIDGLGRVKQTQFNSDPDGVDYTDITYDSLGRKLTVSNPHRAAASSTDGITTFQYDALGRVTQVAPPDGTPPTPSTPVTQCLANNVCTSYNGSSVTITDQAGKLRRSFADGLGRLVEVHEPLSGGLAPATQAAGTVSISGTPQWTQVNQPYWGCLLWDDTGNCIQQGWIDNWVTVYDSGQVTVGAWSCSKSVSYNSASDPASLAAALAAVINADSTCIVSASASGSTITLTSKAAGASTNLSIVASSASDNSQYFSQPSFLTSPSGPTLTGGLDASNDAITLYTYDALNNLTCVEQHGKVVGTGCNAPPSSDPTSPWRVRRYSYNSLSQMVSVTNPESGAISFAYDSEGKLTTKSDARGIITTLAYDELHRVTGKTYTDTTPAATLVYDVASVDGLTIQYPIGRLVKAAQGSTRTVDSFDVLGRILNEWQCTPLNCGTGWFSATYQYNLLGEIISESNPAGFTLTPAYNSAGRLTQLSSSWNDAQHPGNLISAITYNPASELAKLTYGNGLMEARAYNNRLQPCRVNVNSSNAALSQCADALPGGNVLDMTYGFNAGTANNGDIASWSATGVENFSRTYTYDELDRLKTMTSAPCSLAWTYDAWANRTAQTVTGGTCGQSQMTVSNFNKIADPGFQYDPAGNMTAEPGKTYQFDAENRMISINGGSVGAYVYDAGGRRVRKTVASGVTDYFYDLSGNVVAERQAGVWTKAYVYAEGQLVAQYSDSTTYFVHKDHLGSTRMLTTVSQAVFATFDYQPFGESIGSGSATTHKFTGKERDDESGLDDFGARYYSSQYGRFMSADPPFIDQHPGDPQSWNMFAYVRNNPMKFVVPSGNAPQASQPMLIAETTPQDTDPFRSVYGDDDENGVWEVTKAGALIGTFDSEAAAYSAAMAAQSGQSEQQEQQQSRQKPEQNSSPGGTGKDKQNNPRSLTDHEKQTLAPYIPDKDLQAARLHIGKIPWWAFIFGKIEAITVHNDIYIGSKRYDSSKPEDISMLGHELVHVGQYRKGQLSALRYLWESLRHGTDYDNKFEKPAYRMGIRICNDLGCQ